ncbi:MAG TPA: hypothetical protein VF908_02785 [Gemmatimonadaceae bacterium]
MCDATVRNQHAGRRPTRGGDPARSDIASAPAVSPAREADIRKSINEWNNDPRPFIWTKTAEEILEILAAYYGLITDAGLERINP